MVRLRRRWASGFFWRRPSGMASHSSSTTPAAIWHDGSRAISCRAGPPHTGFSLPPPHSFSSGLSSCCQAACTIWIIYVLLREFGLGWSPPRAARRNRGDGAGNHLGLSNQHPAYRYLCWSGRYRAAPARILWPAACPLGAHRHRGDCRLRRGDPQRHPRADRGAHRTRAHRRLVAWRYCSARGSAARGAGH